MERFATVLFAVISSLSIKKEAGNIQPLFS
jgi:hypothetical protein